MAWRGALLLALACLLVAPDSSFAREKGADGSFSERKSRHFVLFQDVASGQNATRRFEREVLSVLEDAYDQVQRTLGIGPRQSVQVVIYDDAVFEREFARLFRFRAAGFYNGVIHVRGRAAIDRRLVATLHHEYVHAALGSVGGARLFPAWLNEGLAEYFERRSLGVRHMTPREHAALSRIAASGGWIPLRNLSGPSFSHMGDSNAGLAYLESYATVEYMLRLGGDRSLRRLVDRLVGGSTLPRALKRTYRADLAGIETGLLEELR